MPQGARTLSFTSSELMIIVFGPILSPQSELSLYYGRTAKDTASLVFYMGDIFRAFKTYQEQYIFLRDHFFTLMVWSRFKLILSKLKMEMTKILALGKEHEIGGRVRLKPDKIEKIFTLPISQDQTSVKSFLGTIQPIRR